jgi:NADPH:quinone reductase-like Zn-dependent oxidoreductase
VGSGTAAMPPREVFAKMLQELLELVASGELRMDIDRVPLSTVASASHPASLGRLEAGARGGARHGAPS